MKKFLTLSFVLIAVVALVFTSAMPARAESHAMMQQALNLIHKAWHPGGKAPSVEKRTQLLEQALVLLRNDPYEHYQGHREKAIRYVNTALFAMHNDFPPEQVNNYLQDAVRQCQDALSDAIY